MKVTLHFFTLESLSTLQLKRFCSYQSGIESWNFSMFSMVTILWERQSLISISEIIFRDKETFILLLKSKLNPNYIVTLLCYETNTQPKLNLNIKKAAQVVRMQSFKLLGFLWQTKRIFFSLSQGGSKGNAQFCSSVCTVTTIYIPGRRKGGGIRENKVITSWHINVMMLQTSKNVT